VGKGGIKTMKQKYTCKECKPSPPCHIVIHTDNDDTTSDMIGSASKKQCLVLSTDRTAIFKRVL
jgi:hypothetical protein